MTDYDSLDDNAFRLMVREWIAANYPQRIRNPPRRLGREAREWYLLLSRQGWLCPGWPREYGGMGLSAGKQLIMMEEMEERLRAPARQRRDHARPIVDPLWRRGATGALPPRILSGEDIWCQGCSEPNAGSDLASLRTEARLENGEWVINGQKTWTTMGSEANWIFLLVRTERSAKRSTASASCWCRWTAQASRCGRSSTWSCTASSAKCFQRRAGALRQPGRRNQPGLEHGQGAARFRADLPRFAQAVHLRPPAPGAPGPAPGTVARPSVRAPLRRVEHGPGQPQGSTSVSPNACGVGRASARRYPC